MTPGVAICENCGDDEVAYGLPVCMQCADAGVLDDEGDEMPKVDRAMQAALALADEVAATAPPLTQEQRDIVSMALQGFKMERRRAILPGSGARQDCHADQRSNDGTLTL